MSFLDMVAKAKASGTRDGDFFFANVRGEMEIERIFKHEGENGTSVILVGTVLKCEGKSNDTKMHTVGSKVKKIYSITKYPKAALSQLKGDILNIMGLEESKISESDFRGLLEEIFEDSSSSGFEFRGYVTAFDTRVIDRSAKGKEPITGVAFKHLPNDEKGLAERKASIDAKLKA